MQHTYEITEADGGWIANVYKDNILLIHQPHHPQQNLEQDGPFWKSKEDVSAWAEETILLLNNPETFISPVVSDPPAELPNLNKEQEIENIKDMLARIAGVPIEKININTDGE